jgi:glycosyltransferase involved in cell wall biosynthesis
VDTGSIDDSPAIARDCGARVFGFLWRGDFAAARNYALEKASGNWILYIDADEYAQPIDVAALNGTLADPALVAATVRFRPRANTTRHHLCRLFRNDPRIRFRHVIHETMLPDVYAVAASDDLQIGRSCLALDHAGYDGSQDTKHRRDIPLLRARLARQPEHVYSWSHLGRALASLGDRPGAKAAWLRAIDIVRGRGEYREADNAPYESLLIFEGADAGPELLREARERFPGNLFFQWMEGRRLVSSSQFQDAVVLLEPLAQIDPDTFCSEDGIAYDMRLFAEATWELLALCYFRLEQFARSADLYSLAAAAAPDNRTYAIMQKLAGARAATLTAARLTKEPEP